MRILFAASECVPFIKTGGLADVVGSLAPVLAQKGHDVRVILPKYAAIAEKYENQMHHVIDFEVQLGWRRQYCGIESLEMDGVTYYFVDNRYYFGRNYIYGLGGDEYERFAFFARAVLNCLPLIPFEPDIIHAHDWQAGMVPALLRIQYSHLPAYASIKTVMTIHNLQYQGIFGIRDVQDVLHLPDSVFTDDKLECHGAANYLKAGLVYADEVTTVSPSYAEEIQTGYYGERLDGLLRAKRDHLTGVLNGIDTVEYDPSTDPSIPQRYSVEDMSGKAANKRALQEQLGLEVRPDVPIIGMVSRLSNQKGLDLVDYVIADIMREDVQLVVLGMGDSRYVNLFSWAEQNYPGRVAARFAMDHDLAHRIYAGSDIFLMPSQFEPCGLSQMISLRYGTVPVVRETGGLRDTVLSYNDYTGAGNGFTFFNYNAHDMLHTLQRALHYYHDRKDVWKTLRERGMSGDYSWRHSAEMYISLYQSILPGEQRFTQPVQGDPHEAAPQAPAKKPAAKKAASKKEAKATDPHEPKEKPAKAAAKPAAKKTTAKAAPKAGDPHEPAAAAAKAPAKKATTKKAAAKSTDPHEAAPAAKKPSKK